VVREENERVNTVAEGRMRETRRAEVVSNRVTKGGGRSKVGGTVLL